MNERRLAVAVGLLLLCSGCAGNTWFSRVRGQQPKVIQPADQIAQLERLQKNNLAKSGSQFLQSHNSLSHNSLTRGAKNAMAKIASALAIEPKVIKAPDPVRLVGNTTTVGYQTHLDAGRFFENLGQFARAQDQYQRALEKEPNQLETLLSLGRLLDRLGNLPQATLVYQQAVAAHPKNAVAHNDLGLSYARQDDFPRAAAEFSAAIQIDPQSKLYRNNIATILVEQGRYDEAFSQLSQTHSEVVAHYNMGYLVQQKDGPEQARRHYEQALRIDPNFAPARQALLLQTSPVKPPADNAQRLPEATLTLIVFQDGV